MYRDTRHSRVFAYYSLIHSLLKILPCGDTPSISLKSDEDETRAPGHSGHNDNGFIQKEAHKMSYIIFFSCVRLALTCVCSNV